MRVTATRSRPETSATGWDAPTAATAVNVQTPAGDGSRYVSLRGERHEVCAAADTAVPATLAIVSSTVRERPVPAPSSRPRRARCSCSCPRSRRASSRSALAECAARRLPGLHLRSESSLASSRSSSRRQALIVVPRRPRRLGRSQSARPRHAEGSRDAAEQPAKRADDAICPGSVSASSVS